MDDPPRLPRPEEDAGRSAGRGAASSTPRWLFALGIIIALIVLMVLLHLTGTLGPRAH